MSIKNVIENKLCIGCGACAVQNPKKYSLGLNENGLYEAKLNRNISSHDPASSLVCPFSDDGENESEIAQRVFPNCLNHSDVLGYYESLYAGYSKEFRKTGSSGGIITWLLEYLLKNV